MPPNDHRDLSEEELSDLWGTIIGPVYDREGLREGFGYTTAQINAMVAARSILELVTSDGTVFYPASCFDEHGRPPPRLPEVIAKLREKEIADPWGLAMWLNSKAEEWDGRSALELLRTEEWVDEVVTQAGEHGRSPLWARRWQVEKMAIAKPILDRFVELVADLPVHVAESTLFVTRETNLPYGVFAMSIAGRDEGLLAVQFGLETSTEVTARGLASMIEREISLARPDNR